MAEQRRPRAPSAHLDSSVLGLNDHTPSSRHVHRRNTEGVETTEAAPAVAVPSLSSDPCEACLVFRFVSSVTEMLTRASLGGLYNIDATLPTPSRWSLAPVRRVGSCGQLATGVKTRGPSRLTDSCFVLCT